MPRTLCEHVAAPLLDLHRRTSSPAGMVGLEIVALGVTGYGIAAGNPHIVWGGALGAVVAWYGFLLSGCERLLAAKEQELHALTLARIQQPTSDAQHIAHCNTQDPADRPSFPASNGPFTPLA